MLFLVFSGHHDDEKYLDKPGYNPGNFQSLLKFRIESGNKSLGDCFSEDKNATYNSKTMQHEIIQPIGEEVLQKIVQNIQEDSSVQH